MARSAIEKFNDLQVTTTSNTKYSESKSVVVTRANTTKDLRMRLPADAYITAVLVNNTGAAASNAATTAVINTFVGNNTTQVNVADVKAAATPTVTSLTNLDTIASVLSNNPRADIPVYIQYAETGAASSSGGPWVVVVEYVV